MKKITKYILIAVAIILAFILIRSLAKPGIQQQEPTATTVAFETIVESESATKPESVMGPENAAASNSESVNVSETKLTADQDTGKPQTVSADIETEILRTESAETEAEIPNESASAGISIDEDGEYTSKDEVALYIHIYGKLPKNYITKSQAKKKGWNQEEGNLRDVLPGMSIGGGPFGNNEGLLPEAKGRKYYECDIDYQGGKRNAKRIIYSNDGLIFYTDDHYQSFEQLY